MQDKGKNMKTYKWLLGAVVLLFLCWPFMAWAVVDAPDAGYVGDYANVLSDETEQYIIDSCWQLAKRITGLCKGRGWRAFCPAVCWAIIYMRI